MRRLPLLLALGLGACPSPGPYVENLPPVAVAGADRRVEVDELLDLDGSASRDDDGAIETWTWNLGDGTTRDGPRVQHRYGAAGRYLVALTVVDDRGGQGRDELLVDVGGAVLSAVASASPSPAQVFEVVRFDGSQSTPATELAAHRWSFGDGATAEGALQEHAYGASGRYRAVLEVADAAGHTARDEVFVDVVPLALDGVYDLSASPASVSCAEYAVAFGEAVLTLDSSGGELAGTTDTGHAYGGTQDGLSFALGASYSQATGGGCGLAPVRATLSGTFDRADHFAGTATAYYDLPVPCQCSALFAVEGQRR